MIDLSLPKPLLTLKGISEGNERAHNSRTKHVRVAILVHNTMTRQAESASEMSLIYMYPRRGKCYLLARTDELKSQMLETNWADGYTDVHV